MSETLNGTVIWWNRDKGYGIADVCGDERQILLHKSQISYGYKEGEEFYLRGGDSIEFETHKVNPNIAKNKEHSIANNTALFSSTTGDDTGTRRFQTF